jgi:TldD protein
MLEKLEAAAAHLKSPGEIRWHANFSTAVSMRKGVLLANGQSRESGVSARIFEGGVYGFAALAEDDDDALRAVLAKAQDNARSLGQAARRRGFAPLASQRGEGVFDHHSPLAACTAQQRVDILRRLDETIRAKYPELVNVDISLSSNASEKALRRAHLRLCAARRARREDERRSQ